MCAVWVPDKPSISGEFLQIASTFIAIRIWKVFQHRKSPDLSQQLKLPTASEEKHAPHPTPTRMFERFQQPQKGNKSNLPPPPHNSFKTRGHISTRDSRGNELCLLAQSSLVTKLLSDSVLENFSALASTHNDTSATPTCERIFAVWIVSRLSSRYVCVSEVTNHLLVTNHQIIS